MKLLIVRHGEPDYTVVTEMLQGYSYRLRGQLNMPDVDCILDLPEGTALHFLEDGGNGFHTAGPGMPVRG